MPLRLCPRKPGLLAPLVSALFALQFLPSHSATAAETAAADWQRFELRAAGLVLQLPPGPILTAANQPDDYDADDFGWEPQDPVKYPLYSLDVLTEDYGARVLASELLAECEDLSTTLAESLAAGTSAKGWDALFTAGRDWLRWEGTISDAEETGSLRLVVFGTRQGPRTHSFVFYFPDEAAEAACEGLMRQILEAAQFAQAPALDKLRWQRHDIGWHGLRPELPAGQEYRDKRTPGWNEDPEQESTQTGFIWSDPQLPLYVLTAIVQEDIDYDLNADSSLAELAAGFGSSYRIDPEREQLESHGQVWGVLRADYLPGDIDAGEAYLALTKFENRNYMLLGQCDIQDSAAARQLFDEVLSRLEVFSAPPTQWPQWVSIEVPGVGLSYERPGGGISALPGSAEWPDNMPEALQYIWEMRRPPLQSFRLGSRDMGEEKLSPEKLAAIMPTVSAAIVQKLGDLQSAGELPQQEANGIRWYGRLFEGRAGEYAGFHVALYMAILDGRLLVACYSFRTEDKDAGLELSSQMVQRIEPLPKSGWAESQDA